MVSPTSARNGSRARHSRGAPTTCTGPMWDPRAAIYWTKGAFAEQTYDRPGRPPLVTRAAHIFRRRPGTTLVEPVIAGGMDNPVDVAFTAVRRSDFHGDLSRASAGRPPRRAHSRRVRRALRQAAQRARQPGAHRRPDAAALSFRARRAGGTHQLRVRRVRAGLSRQFLCRALQHAEGDAARACHRLARPSRAAIRTSWSPTASTSTRPTSSRTPTAACSSSTPAGGTSSAARRRSWPSPRSWGRSTACDARPRPGSPTLEARQSRGRRRVPSS